MKNKIQPFLDERGITPYRFWHDTGISRVTAYKLYNDSTYIPGADVLVKICDTYQIQPGVILVWFSEEDDSSQGQNPPSGVEEKQRQEAVSTSVGKDESMHSYIKVFPKKLPSTA